MLDVRYSHLYFYQSLNRLQCGLSAIAELLLYFCVVICLLCILYRVFLLFPRPTVNFYMYICRIMTVQFLGCHIEIYVCLDLT